jgi:hypothetical protein
MKLTKLTIVVALAALTSSAALAGPAYRQTAPKEGRKFTRVVCPKAEGCRIVRYPANGRGFPTVITCKQGEVCHPWCRTACKK